uniref:Odorant-binding protein 10 n=1 Tax=Trichogramma dendrolimi TaxID=114056 RepID=A0A2S0BE11_9HYME|nr:odorant-binding protein 10 [Trichogramma dendrolimi]
MYLIVSLVLVSCILCVHANQVPEEIKNLVAGMREKCHRETGVDIEHVERTVEGYFHESEVLGCYFSCILNSFDLLDHDGHIDFDKLVTRLKGADSFREHGMEMVAACRGTTGKNPCDSAFNVFQCFQKTNPAKYFVI